MSHISSHVLDAAEGTPAAAVSISLVQGGTVIDSGATDADGRLNLGPDRLEPGDYALIFDTGAYFGGRGIRTFYPSATVAFTIGDESVHEHVPLLLSPFSYSTYRGS